MYTKQVSLQGRVFFGMVLLVIISSVLIGIVTILQYKEQSEEYNQGRLKRKEHAIVNHINSEIDNCTTGDIQETLLSPILSDRIVDIAKIHNMEVEVHGMNGELLVSSDVNVDVKRISDVIVDDVLLFLANDREHRLVERNKKADKEYHASYSYLYNKSNEPIGILHLPYLENSETQEKELKEFLARLAFGFFVMFLIGLGIAYVISSYITRSIKTVSDKMSKTRLEKRNEKIELNKASKEIHILVDAYNSMVDDLEESAIKLAKGEREQAWREMAKQVAHEIKNPLTPLRLTVQSFERKFDATDPDINQRIHEFSNTLIQQIDVMSSIASAFSDFANMPKRNKEYIDIVEVVKGATEIFTESYICFYSSEEEIVANIDKIQITRVITNLVKNAVQALGNVENPKIEIKVSEDAPNVCITIADNGKGIADDLKNKVFEPKFTTKTSGMGLGLPMVKNIIEAYDGTISFTSEEGRGTVFKVIIPKQ